jgi:hypothetical protein
MTPVITRSAVVVPTTAVPWPPEEEEEAQRTVLVPGIAATTPTKHIPTNEANTQILAVFAS